MACRVSELEDAWAAVHDALPSGWSVNEPSWHVEDSRWHVFVADHRRGRKRPDYVEGTRISKEAALRGLAGHLKVWQRRRSVSGRRPR